MGRVKAKRVSVLLLLLVFTMSCSSAATQEIKNSPTAVIEPTTPPLTVIVEPTSSSTSKVPLSEAEVPRVSLEEALAAIQSGAAIVVDVRSKQAYDESHVAGAISIPLGEVETNPNDLKLDKDQWIITYCT